MCGRRFGMIFDITEVEFGGVFRLCEARGSIGVVALSPLCERAAAEQRTWGFARRPDIRRNANSPAALRAPAPFDEGG
jgi:hypothetical protein